MNVERNQGNNAEVNLDDLYEKPKRVWEQVVWDGKKWVTIGAVGAALLLGADRIINTSHAAEDTTTGESANQTIGSMPENSSNERLSALGVQTRTATPDSTPSSEDIRTKILNSEEGDVLHIEDPNLVKMYEVSFGLASFHVSVLADNEGDAVLYVVNSACFEGEDLPEPVQKLGRIVWEMEEAHIANTDIKIWEKGSGLNIGVLESYEAERAGDVQEVDCKVPALYSGGREFLRRSVRGAVGIVRDVYDATRDEIRGQ